jgi:hypothetical protein
MKLLYESSGIHDQRSEYNASETAYAIASVAEDGLSSASFAINYSVLIIHSQNSREKSHSNLR